MRFFNTEASNQALSGNFVDIETRQLLPWYVNGTVDAVDRKRVEAALRADSNAEALLAWEKATRHAVKTDPMFDVADDRGLAKTMQRIRATGSAASRGSGSDWLARLAQAFRWSPALAVACGVVAVQFAVITQMWSSQSEESEYAAVRAVTVRPNATEAFLRVVFKPETTEADLRGTLRGVQAEIVSGPSQLGDYYVLVAKDAAARALTSLQTSRHVEAVELVDALPAKQ